MTYTNIDSLTSQSRIVLSSLSFKGKGSRSLHLCHPPTPFKETSWSWRHNSQGQVLRHFRFGIDIMAVGEKTEHSISVLCFCPLFSNSAKSSFWRNSKYTYYQHQCIFMGRFPFKISPSFSQHPRFVRRGQTQKGC